MRYYFIHEDDFIFDINSAKKINQKTFKLNVSLKDKSYDLILKKLANKYFYSFDNLNYKKLTNLNGLNSILHCDKTLKVFRGFKPSSLSSEESGNLVTQMPGKVVKILGKVGDNVSVGQTLVIIEAMKMENEIKSNSNGKITSISIKEGQALDSGVVMMEIEVLGE